MSQDEAMSGQFAEQNAQRGPQRPGGQGATWLAYILLALAVLLAFRHTPSLGFSDYDDPVLVASHPLVSQGLTGDGIRHAFTTPQLNLWVPLTTISHMLDVTLFGTWAGGHHLTSVLLHLATSLLLFALFLRTTNRLWPSFAVALVFAIHPLRVETVVWIAARKDVLSGLFFVLCLWFYTSWVRTSRRRLYLAAVVCAAAAAMSKPAVMTLPLALLCFDFWPLGRFQNLREGRRLSAALSLLKEKIPFFVIGVAVAAVTWATWSGNQFFPSQATPGLATRAIHTALTYGSFLWRTLWPVDLAPYYPHPESIPWPALVASIATWCALVVLAFRLRHRAPWVFAGVFWFLLLALPASGLVTLSDAFAPDRYTHLPHIGLMAAAVFSFAAIRVPGQRRARIATTAAILAALGLPLLALTARQSRHWSTPETLWQHTLDAAGPSHLALHQLALVRLRQERPEEGIRLLREAVDREPRHPVTRGSLALALARTGDMAGALAEFRAAGESLPHRQRFLDEIALRMAAAGDEDAGLALLVENQSDKTTDAPALLERGHAAYAANRQREALFFYRRATRADPRCPQAAQTLGAMWLHLGEPAQAIPVLETGVNLDDPHATPRSLHLLAQAHMLTGNFTQAAATYEKALAAAADSGVIRHELAILHLDPNHAATHHPDRALDLLAPLADTPHARDPAVLHTLCRALLATGQPAAAAETAERALAALRANPNGLLTDRQPGRSFEEWFEGVATGRIPGGADTP